MTRQEYFLLRKSVELSQKIISWLYLQRYLPKCFKIVHEIIKKYHIRMCVSADNWAAILFFSFLFIWWHVLIKPLNKNCLSFQRWKRHKRLIFNQIGKKESVRTCLLIFHFCSFDIVIGVFLLRIILDFR